MALTTRNSSRGLMVQTKPAEPCGTGTAKSVENLKGVKTKQLKSVEYDDSVEGVAR